MRFVGRVAILLILATAAAAVHSMYWPIYRNLADQTARQSSSAQADPGPAPQPSDDPEAPQPVPAPPDYYISVERAYQLWEEGMPFVDARTDAERVVGTVEGALHLETRDFIDGTAGPKLQELDRAFPVVVFCAGGECDASENVAVRLGGLGFKEILIMHEGFGAWQAAGHPTEAVGGG